MGTPPPASTVPTLLAQSTLPRLRPWLRILRPEGILWTLQPWILRPEPRILWILRPEPRILRPQPRILRTLRPRLQEPRILRPRIRPQLLGLDTCPYLPIPPTAH